MDTWVLEVKQGNEWEETKVSVPNNYLIEGKDVILKLRDADKDLLLDFQGKKIRLVSPFFDAEQTEILHFEVNEFRDWTFYKNAIIALDPSNSFLKYKIKV